MSKRSRAIAFVITLFILITIFVIYILSELFTESAITNNNNNDPKKVNAFKFKEEYEELNGRKSGEKVIRTISIPEDNPFIYKTAEEIVEMMNNKESFIVYFGFAKCPWCRSVLPTLIESAKNNNIDTIYYVDVLDIRDVYELNTSNKPVKSKEGSKGYNELLEKLYPVLDDYTLTYKKGKKTETIKVTEDNKVVKRIFAPNVVVIKNGNPIALETGISDLQKDAYQELTDAILCEIKEKFNCLFERYNEDNNSCSVGEPIC